MNIEVLALSLQELKGAPGELSIADGDAGSQPSRLLSSDLFAHFRKEGHAEPDLVVEAATLDREPPEWVARPGGGQRSRSEPRPPVGKTLVGRLPGVLVRSRVVPYFEHSVVEPLRPLVECAWTFTEDPGRPSLATHLVLPDGCVDVIVDQRRPRVFVVGAMTVAQEVTLEVPAELVAIRFRPGGAFPALGLPLSELTDLQIELSELRDDAEGILRAVQGLRGASAAIALQQELAVRPMTGSLPAPRWRAAIRALTCGTAPPVRELSDRLGLSRQYLARRCKDLVGVSPKRLARIARMRRLLQLVDGGEPGGWAGAAIAAGYYDQAHMIREVKELTGRTPGQLRRLA